MMEQFNKFATVVSTINHKLNEVENNVGQIKN